MQFAKWSIPPSDVTPYTCMIGFSVGPMQYYELPYTMTILLPLSFTDTLTDIYGDVCISVSPQMSLFSDVNTFVSGKLVGVGTQDADTVSISYASQEAVLWVFALLIEMRKSFTIMHQNMNRLYLIVKN